MPRHGIAAIHRALRVNVVTVFELEVTGSAAIRFVASPDLGRVEA